MIGDKSHWKMYAVYCDNHATLACVHIGVNILSCLKMLTHIVPETFVSLIDGDRKRANMKKKRRCTPSISKGPKFEFST